MSRPANIAAWLATEQPHIDLAYVGKDTTIADAKAEIVRLDAELARYRAIAVASNDCDCAAAMEAPICPSCGDDGHVFDARVGRYVPCPRCCP